MGSPLEKTNPRVIALAPMPPEKSAYALARYSRSPDSILESIEWVRTHDSTKFLESFYFQYGHASIADLGHVAMCFEGISELVATEIEDEQLWDGQARSSRYQDFSRAGFVIPPELIGADAAAYSAAAGKLLEAYHRIHKGMCEFLSAKLPRPDEMKPDAYHRNIAARAFDVARYVLFFGIPTGVGQVTSIRTLERQIRRLKSSEYAEAREIAEEIAAACGKPPACALDTALAIEPIAPTLARHVDADEQAMKSHGNLRCWAVQNLPQPYSSTPETVDLLRPDDAHAEIAATLLYPVTERPFRELYEVARSWPAARRNEVIDIGLGPQRRRSELPRAFRNGPYIYDIVMDIGAYRDFHRHRRCQQFRQAYSGRMGYDTPEAVIEAGQENTYRSAMADAFETLGRLPASGADYLLPFGARSRFLFKMDFAEAEYVARLRSGVKGHFSYRRIAWEMKRKMEQLEPELGRLMDATPPWVEDPLKR